MSKVSVTAIVGLRCQLVTARISDDPEPCNRSPPGVGSSAMNDAEIVSHIDALVEEEHRLERSHTEGGLSEDERARLRDVEVQLDQLWDLLRQRRARRSAGQDPDGAQERPESIVEHFQQ